MIFPRFAVQRRNYLALVARVERRAADCGRDEGGKFGPKNQCQDDGQGGGGTSTPVRDDSWKDSIHDQNWSREDLQKSSPISGGAKLSLLKVQSPRIVSEAISGLGLSGLDSIVAIGGGAVRDAVVDVSPYDEDELSVHVGVPIDPSNPTGARASWHVSISRDAKGTYVDYGGFYTSSEVSDPSGEKGVNSASRLRVASLLRQRVLESMMAAEATGVSNAHMVAAGDDQDTSVQGYRLWPQFGFDAPLENLKTLGIPDDIVVASAGLAMPPAGSTRLPQETVLRGLRQQVKSLTLQQLVSTREGKRWWDRNGSDIMLSFNFSDKNSPGYKKFREAQEELPRLRIRNEGRSLWRERRDCGRDEGGKFGPKNECQEDGAATNSESAATKFADSGWKKSRDEDIGWGREDLKVASPVEGGDQLKRLDILQPKKVASAMKAIGLEDLDAVVKMGGGAVRGGEITVSSFDRRTVSISGNFPIDPNDPDSSQVTSGVDLSLDGGELSVHYDGFSTGSSVSDPTKLEAGTSDRNRLRIASLMQERMIESLATAQDAGAAMATTFASGDISSTMYQGYRLWPQFGFDAPLSMEDYAVPPEIVLASLKKAIPSDSAKAKAAADKITKKGFSLQQLISTREGKTWWDENGSDTEMFFDLKDKKSLGYARLERLKRLLPKMKERNIAEGRDLFDAETRDCGPSDKDEAGLFTKGNDCQAGAGEGEKPESGSQKPKSLIWTPGQSAGLVTSKTRESLPAVRSDDGKRIISTPIPGAHVYKGRGARQFVGTVDVGGALAAEQDAIRGEKINTSKGVLGGPESEYISASLEEQVRGAMGRGIEPKFYSPEEREDQLAAFAEMIPGVRGGRTKAGAMIEQEDAENLFRVIQAITSPNASPFINMQRTDSLLQKFFNGDGTVTTSDALGVTGAGIKKSLRRFQKIVDTLGKRTDGSIDTAAGLRAARELIQGRSLRTGDVKKFFEDFASPGEKKGAWVPSSYLVDEVVPVFSTFGPKVGPFYANNNGDLDPLTADVWFSRTWGRVTGELVVPGSPTKSAEQATKLAKVIGKASDDQLHGISGDALAESIKQTGETGAVGDLLRAWSGARLRHYARGDYKEKTGTGGKLNQIAKNIVENDTALIGDPGSGSRRSHMIRLMRDVSRKTGTPVAYIQDILWQDEQDAYGALGAMTATNVGEPSLYSDQIKRLASEGGKRRKPRARPDRGYRRDYEQAEPFFDDYERGGREQMLWEAALAHLSDEDFANAVIKLAESARPTEESREERSNFAALDAVVETRVADCGRQEGGRFGEKNQCQDDGAGGGTSPDSQAGGKSLKSAAVRWKGQTSDIGIHVQDELDGKPAPSSAGGQKLREMAASLLAEVKTNSEPAPMLYRGDNKPPSANSSPLLGWTSSKKVAEHWARVYEGQVYELDGANGINLKKIAGEMFDDGEDEWIVMNQPTRKNSRSLTPEFRGDSPAPKKDQITGSDKNAKDSASGKSGDIELKDSTITALKTKAEDHNASMKEAGKANWTRVRVPSLKAVFRRGAGAFSVSHRPGMTRDQWAMARVNAFLTLARRGRPENAKYVGDNDLLHSDHPKYSESRSADCGRDEGGQFGPKNQCQEDGSSVFASNAQSSWTPASSGSSPFEGASKFKEVATSGGAAVLDSLKRSGITAGDAVAVAGAPEGSEVWLRPAPEFAKEFPGSEGPPVLVTFEADVAGVRRGASGSSVVGSQKNPETGEVEKVIYHNVLDVLPAVQEKPASRHAAARGFYKMMVSSIESARKSGIAEVKFSAAGRGDDSASDRAAFKGYTIWPRMGFDAPLPEAIISKLPESLSSSKSLLELHASREGTKWWAENGQDIDVSLRIADRSSPQNRIVDRFVSHFMKQRRSMPLGDGGDWLSPEDLMRLDEMWQEVWDEGDLDEYEWTESRSSHYGRATGNRVRELMAMLGDNEYFEHRSSDCGRSEDGKFGEGNQCQKGAKGVAALAKSGASHDELTAAIAVAIGTKAGFFSGSEKGESRPSEVLGALGLKIQNDAELDKYHASSSQKTREAIARTIAETHDAVKSDPSLKGVAFNVETAESMAKKFGTSPARWKGVAGSYTPQTGEIFILAGTVPSALTNKMLYDGGIGSTPSPGHTLVHEVAHKEHFDSIAAATKSPRPTKGTDASKAAWAYSLRERAYNGLSDAAVKDPEWASRIVAKASGLGFYATTDPLEFYAEYATAVKLGYAKNDPDLDRVCKVMYAPVPKKAKR